MSYLYKLLLLVLVTLVSTEVVYAQDITDDLGGITNERGETFTEKVKVISESKKIFILTNDNKLLSKGDFITVAIDDSAFARALVAKSNNENRTGIKILKILSLKHWSKIGKGSEIQIIKGDASAFMKKEIKKENKEDVKDEIKEIEDLYNADIVSDEDFDVKDDGKRIIKTDNMITAAWGNLNITKPSLTGDGETFRNNQWYGMWAYQFLDNVWAELALGYTGTINDFPTDGTGTVITNLIIRAKYTFSLPFDSYAMPYIGYQAFLVDSPQAGKSNNLILNNKEVAAISDIENKGGIVFGASILKRLVPGWFFKTSFGTDGFTLGFAVEF